MTGSSVWGTIWSVKRILCRTPHTEYIAIPRIDMYKYAAPTQHSSRYTIHPASSQPRSKGRELPAAVHRTRGRKLGLDVGGADFGIHIARPVHHLYEELGRQDSPTRKILQLFISFCMYLVIPRSWSWGLGKYCVEQRLKQHVPFASGVLCGIATNQGQWRTKTEVSLGMEPTVRIAVSQVHWKRLRACERLRDMGQGDGMRLSEIRRCGKGGVLYVLCGPTVRDTRVFRDD